MYKAILIDDEDKVRHVLKIKLEKYCPEIIIVDEASDSVEAYQKILKHNPDLIFLDISLPNETGFDILNKFDKITFETIFVTGYNEYALEALKVSAVDYVLKPVQNDVLKNAVQKAIKRIDEKHDLENYTVLKHNLQNIHDQNAKIAIPGNDYYNFVVVNNIIRCEGWQKYTKVYLVSGEEILSSYNIGVFKDLLEPYGFYSTHKSHMVNNEHIVKYLKEGSVVMSDDSVVPIARRRKDEFLELFIDIQSRR